MFVIILSLSLTSHISSDRWFRQTKYTSFQRQLNIYGFVRISAGVDKNAYFNENFLRGHQKLTTQIKRVAIKGTGNRITVSSSSEPDFYKLPFAVDCSTASEISSVSMVPILVHDTSRHRSMAMDQRNIDEYFRLSRTNTGYGSLFFPSAPHSSTGYPTAQDLPQYRGLPWSSMTTPSAPSFPRIVEGLPALHDEAVSISDMIQSLTRNVTRNDSRLPMLPLTWTPPTFGMYVNSSGSIETSLHHRSLVDELNRQRIDVAQNVYDGHILYNDMLHVSTPNPAHISSIHQYQYQNGEGR
jgi:HSF-type DNA-binding